MYSLRHARDLEEATMNVRSLEECDVPSELCRSGTVFLAFQESRMSVGLVIFRRLACGDMIRDALKGHRNLQPIAHDDRIETLLARLSKAENAQENAKA